MSDDKVVSLKRPKQIYDWARIELLYRANVLTLDEISQQCGGVSAGTIRNRAAKDNWTRDLSTEIKAATQDKMLRAATGKERPTDGEVVATAADAMTRVLMGHRSRIERMMLLVDRKLEEFEQDVTLVAPEDLVKTSNTLKTLIGLERQSYDADNQEVKKAEDIFSLVIQVNQAVQAEKGTKMIDVTPHGG